MLMKTSLYGAAALALSFTFVPAQAQTPEAPAAAPVSAPAAPAPTATTAPPTSPFDMPPAESSVSDDAAATPEEAPEIAAESPTDTGPSLKASDSQKPRYYDDHGNPFTDKYREVAPDSLSLALQRDPALPVGHFVMLLSAAKPAVTCGKILNPKHSTEFANEIMTVKVEKYIVDDRDLPRYAHYECNTTPQEPVAQVNLSRELLEDNQVKKIKFRAGKATETFAVKMTEEYIQLTPETRSNPQASTNRFRPMAIDGVANPLKLWFYPENTVILTADGASKDITLESRLIELASSKGLTPLHETMPEHVHFRKKADYYYFIDKQGRYKSSEGELFDYIQTDAMKFGLEADEPVKKNVAVFIRKPGQYD